jgi:hypothetical protein
VAPELINQLATPYINGFTKAVFDVHRQYCHSHLAGLHCIATGMEWFPTDIPSLKYNYVNIDDARFNISSSVLTQRRDEWKKAVKSCRTPYMFLKENFYNE